MTRLVPELVVKQPDRGEYEEAHTEHEHNEWECLEHCKPLGVITDETY